MYRIRIAGTAVRFCPGPPTFDFVCILLKDWAILVTVSGFSQSQLERASEVFGNVSVAWFSAGVISPLFVPSRTVLSFIFYLGTSLLMAIVFFVLSLMLLARDKND